MAHSAQLRVTRVGGTYTYDLIYAAGSQTTYYTRYGMRVQGAEPTVLLHRPDNSPGRPIDAIEPDKIIFLTMDIQGADNDAVLDAVIPLKRALNGADSQALRQAISDDIGDVVCRIQLNGATNYTDYRVMWGWVDDSRAYYSDVAYINSEGREVVVMLHCEPFGEGASISLDNYLASSPHFIESASGLGHGWNETGSPTTTIETTRALIGGKSQKVVTSDNSSAEGIYCDTVTASSSSTGVCYAWISADSASCDDITLMFRDGSGNLIQQIVYDPATPANYDLTVNDGAGNAWYRYSASGTNSTAANMVLHVQRAASGASQISTFYVDACYLEVGTTTAPGAWISARAQDNRNDPDYAEANVGYTDLWGAPGDAPALMTLASDLTDNSNDHILIYASSVEGLEYPNNLTYLDNTLITKQAGAGSYTASAGAGTVYWNNNFGLYTESGTPGATPLLRVTASAATSLIMAKMGPMRLYMSGYSVSGAEAALYSTVAVSGCGVSSLPTAFATHSVTALVDLGILTPSPTVLYQNAGGQIIFDIQVDGLPASQGFRVDAIIMMPVSNGFVVGHRQATQNVHYVDGVEEALYTSSSPAASDKQSLGSLWTIPAGGLMTRVLHLHYTNDANETYTSNDTMNITATLVPRTTHLLGTI